MHFWPYLTWQGRRSPSRPSCDSCGRPTFCRQKCGHSSLQTKPRSIWDNLDPTPSCLAAPNQKVSLGWPWWGTSKGPSLGASDLSPPLLSFQFPCRSSKCQLRVVRSGHQCIFSIKIGDLLLLNLPFTKISKSTFFLEILSSVPEPKCETSDRSVRTGWYQSSYQTR